MKKLFILLAILLCCGQSPVSAADAAKLPRVLLIGDSISIGYTDPTREQLKGVAEVHRIPGNAGHTGMGLERLEQWLDPGKGRWDVIHFNWGLWDLCYRHPGSKNPGQRDKVRGKVTHTPEQYRANLRRIVARLKQTGARLIWASTTPVPEGESGRKVGDDLVYNAVAAKVMKENGIPINDLHALMVPRMKSLAAKPGDVHFNRAGYALLADQVAQAIRDHLPPAE